MNAERRLSAAETASSTSTKKSGPIVTPTPDAPALFDVVSGNAYGADTAYVPTAELSQALDNAGGFWQATARAAIRAMAQTRRTFTIDDLREDGLVPPPVTNAAWGAALHSAAAAGDITCVGYRKSRRRESHSRIVSVWTIA